jgi:hypothetical protein
MLGTKGEVVTQRGCRAPSARGRSAEAWRAALVAGWHLLGGCVASYDYTAPPPTPTVACAEAGIESFEGIVIEPAPLTWTPPTGSWDGLESMNLRTPYLFESGVYMPMVHAIHPMNDAAPVVRVECNEPLGVDWWNRQACMVGREPYVPHGTAHLVVEWLMDPRKKVEFQLPCLAREVSIRAFHWNRPLPHGIAGLDADGNIVAPANPVPLAERFADGVVRTETLGGEAAIARIKFVGSPDWPGSIGATTLIDQLEWR